MPKRVGAELGGQANVKRQEISHVTGLLDHVTKEEIYRELAGKVGIPLVYYYEREVEDYNVLVLELLGLLLEDLFNYYNRRFSLKTILFIANQAIYRIKQIYRRYIYRNIKLDNFLLGTGRQGNIIYTINFGVAKEFSSEERYLRLRGLPVGVEDQSWSDDLESLGYMFIYFARGSLPWQGLRAVINDEELDLIKEMKMSLLGEELCDGLLLIEFAKYINYTRSVDARDKPNYRYLRNLFRNRFRSEGFEYDHVFDWTVKRFFELHGEGSVPEDIE
ncbi:casein kinase I isoform delta [Astrocystis sublimbata]|nr:casein kinase I isoform delta [Astrocystis sublimbata]